MLDGKQLIKDLYFPNSESPRLVLGNKAIAWTVPQRSSWNHYFLGGPSLFSASFFFLRGQGTSLRCGPQLGIICMLLATFTRWLSCWICALRSSLSCQRLANFYVHRKRRKRISTHVRRWKSVQAKYRVLCAICQALCQVRSVIIRPLIQTHTLAHRHTHTYTRAQKDSVGLRNPWQELKVLPLRPRIIKYLITKI